MLGAVLFFRYVVSLFYCVVCRYTFCAFCFFVYRVCYNFFGCPYLFSVALYLFYGGLYLNYKGLNLFYQAPYLFYGRLFLFYEGSYLNYLGLCLFVGGVYLFYVTLCLFYGVINLPAMLIRQPQVVLCYYLSRTMKVNFDTCLNWGLEAPNTDLIYILESEAKSTKPDNGL